MSIEVMTAVWKLQLTHAEKLVLLAMADHADDYGLCFPSIERIAWKSGYSLRQIQRIVHDLTARGLLHIEAEATWERSTRYTIHPEKGAPLPPFRPGVKARGDKMSSHDKDDRKTVSSDANGASNATTTVSQMSPESSERTVIESSGNRRARDDEPTSSFFVKEVGVPSTALWSTIRSDLIAREASGPGGRAFRALLDAAALIDRAADGTFIVGVASRDSAIRLQTRHIHTIRHTFQSIVGPTADLEIVVTAAWWAHRAQPEATAKQGAI